VENLHVYVENRIDFAIVRPVGEVDLATASLLKEAFVQAIEAGQGLVVMDAVEMTFLDSSGLGVLVFAHKRLVQAGRKVVLANLSRQVSRAVLVTGLDEVILTHVTDDPVAPWDDPAATGSDVLAVLSL
jgi:anti-anti-sigma factor